MRRGAAINIRFENIIRISDFVTTDPYGFGILFVLNLKPSPLGNRGLYIDEKYWDTQLRRQIMFLFLKLSLDKENAHFMNFVENCYVRPQGVPAEDKIPFEEYD